MTRGRHAWASPERTFDIPPGAANHPVRSSLHLPGRRPPAQPDAAHAPARQGLPATRRPSPTARQEILLSVPAYDFAWQSIYRLAEPSRCPKGTRIDCLAHFDNSAKNPANPDPTQTVVWGDQTWEEMMIGYIDYAKDLPAAGSVRPGQRDPTPPRSVRAIHKNRDQSVDTPSPFCQSPLHGARNVTVHIYRN